MSIISRNAHHHLLVKWTSKVLVDKTEGGGIKEDQEVMSEISDTAGKVVEGGLSVGDVGVVKVSMTWRMSVQGVTANVVEGELEAE